MPRIPRWLLPLAVLALVWLLSGDALACPNCKEAMANQTGDAARLKDGYYYSILLMIAMPFTLLTTGAFFVARAVKKGLLPPL
jgi:hypothetical protein